MVMRRAKVSELKARLSSYLSDVRGGATILVCDRNTPIARLVPTDDEGGLQVREPTRPVKDLKRIKGVQLDPPVDVVRVLRSDRDRR